MPLDRRTFLSGATTVAALGAAGLPRVAFASTDEGVELGARVMGLRRRWAAERQDYLDSMFSERASAESSDLTPFTLALGNGLGALSTYKDLEEVPVEEQMHPRFQELILDVAEGLGGMLVSCRELLEHFLDGADADPLREAHLRASLRSVRLSLSEWRTTGARQKSLEHGLLEIEREPEPGALLRRVRHQVARLKRAEVLADQVAANWEQSDVLRVADPALLARMDEGRARWAAAGVDAGVQADDGTGTSYGGGVPVDEETHSRGVHRLVLGIVVLGVGCLVGAVLVLVGGCALACSGGVGAALVMLAGLAVLGLALWLGLSLIFKGRAMMKGHGWRRPSCSGRRPPRPSGRCRWWPRRPGSRPACGGARIGSCWSRAPAWCAAPAGGWPMPTATGRSPATTPWCPARPSVRWWAGSAPSRSTLARWDRCLQAWPESSSSR